MSRSTLPVALAQMCSADRHGPNIDSLRDLAAKAAAGGASLLCLPEASGCMNRDREKAREFLAAEPDDPYFAACREAAVRHGIWIHTGSTPMRHGAGARFANRSHLVDSDGEIVARYDKIHLFDVDLPDGVRRRESDRYAPGCEAVLAETPWGPFGMSVCYDIRFPHLYRGYARAGATVLFAPSAFAVSTGAAHWEILLRARAIENGCYVVAAAQSGHHLDGRRTWGHSMIVDPWGDVVTDMGVETGLAFCALDLDRVRAVRAMIPSLKNERPYQEQAGASHMEITVGD